MKLTTPMLFLAASLFVAAPAMSMSGYASIGHLPAAVRQGNVTYVTGGVGQSEAAAIRRDESDFPLALEFIKHADAKVELLAGVNVTIKDKEGKTVLSAIADGPFLLAKLPDGQYDVTAVDEGRAMERKVVVARDKSEHVTLEW